jgi:hypothetical protein
MKKLAIAYGFALIWLPVLCAVFLTGCSSSSPQGSGLLGWWATRGERAERKAEAKYEDTRESQLIAARLEAEKTAQAAAVLPDSPEADLTQRFAGNTVDLLAQSVPGVSADQLAAVRQLIADLRSQDAKVVAAAERRQAQAEKDNDTLSRKLADAADKLTAAESRADVIAADNAKLAGQMLALKWATGLATFATIAATVAAFAYRTNAFGFADGIARGIVDIRRKNPAIADIVTDALDAGLNRPEQSAVFKRVSSLINP